MNLAILVDPIVTAKSPHIDSPRFSLKDADIAALEVALHLKSRGFIQEISIFCATNNGDEHSQALLYCFALGATQVTRIVSKVLHDWDKQQVATIIKNAIGSTKLDLIFCGSGIFGNAPVGSFLAALAGYPFTGGALALEFDASTSNVYITRKLGAKYTEAISCQIPCIIGIDAFFPRPMAYPSFRSIKQAKTDRIIHQAGLASDAVFSEYYLFVEEIDYKIPVQLMLDYPRNLSALDRIMYLSRGPTSQVINSKIILDQETGIKKIIDTLISKVEILQD